MEYYKSFGKANPNHIIGYDKSNGSIIEFYPIGNGGGSTDLVKVEVECNKTDAKPTHEVKKKGGAKTPAKSSKSARVCGRCNKVGHNARTCGENEVLSQVLSQDEFDSIKSLQGDGFTSEEVKANLMLLDIAAVNRAFLCGTYAEFVSF